MRLSVVIVVRNANTYKRVYKCLFGEFVINSHLKYIQMLVVKDSVQESS
jgi:hypothetical protein